MVSQAIIDAYKAAQQTITGYEPLRPIYDFCRSYDPALFKVRACVCVCVCVFVCVCVRLQGAHLHL